MSITIDPNNPTASAKLTFDDEFNALNLSNGTSGVWGTNFWYNITGDPKAIDSLPSNGEQEWYIDSNDPRTKGVTPWTVDSSGVLHIKASPTPSNIAPAVNNYPYISGELNTHNSFSQQYGLFEMRAKLPAGQGFWPAFWMLPENGQWPPELDIMENLGQDTSNVYTTVHSNTIPNGYSSMKNPVADTTQWHTYAVDWESDFVTWYIDGKAVHKEATPTDMNLPMYMELNLAVGGNWPGNPNASTNFNHDMQVDWVKVYQSNAELAAGYAPTGSAANYGVNGGGPTPTPTPTPPPGSLYTASAATISGGFDALNANSAYTSIVISDNGALTLTAAQLLNDTHALGELKNANGSAYTLDIADTGAHISSALSALGSNSHVASIKVTDGATVTVAANQYAADTAVLNKISGAHTVEITGYAGAGYTAQDLTYGASGTLTERTYHDTDGSLSITGFVGGLTFQSGSHPQSVTVSSADDTFVFDAGFAAETITGYRPGADVIDISRTVASSASTVISHAHGDGHGGTLISFAPGETIDLVGVSLSHLRHHTGDFHFF